MNSLKSTALSPVRTWDERFQIRTTTTTRTIQNSRLRVVGFTSCPPKVLSVFARRCGRLFDHVVARERLSRALLHFENQVLMVTVSATPPHDRADVGVDRLDDDSEVLPL